MLTAAVIKAQALGQGFHAVGIASIEDNYQDEAETHLRAWLGRGDNAAMEWMANPKRQDIRAVFPEGKAVIALALNYYTPHNHSQNPAHGKISRYAWGRDYHKVLSKKIKIFSQWVESHSPEIKTRYYVDTGPVQEKVWAQRAGIGWIGKNGNLITRKYGSWVFLGEILVNIELEADSPHSSHCGTCRRCLAACPTQALGNPYFVNAHLCIAYHTIENRSPELPTAIASKLENWVAGCDICQDVCPWNQRFAQETNVSEFQPYLGNIAPKLEELADLSAEEWNQRFRASALRRIKPQMWRRNALANLNNHQKQALTTNDH
jgi:epoxyqueuosine reductase